MKFLLSKPLKVRRSKTFFYAIFQISPRKIEERKSLYYYKYAYYKKFSVFYGFRAVSIFVKYCSSIFRNNINYSSFFLRLGCKLDYLLFCLNFFPSIYFIQKFIAGKNVYINNMTISNFHHVVGLNEIVSFNRKYFCLLYDYLIKNLLLRRVFVNVPNYIEVDYKLLVVLVCTLPSPSSINKPFTSGGQPFTPYR